jgi:hypothetical protein
MARRRKEKKTYKYECTLTGEEFVLTEKAENPDDLVSVKAYYELHPEQDDRPADVKKLLGISTEEE